MVDLEVRLLYNSPHRTLDPDQAQFVIIDAPMVATRVFGEGEESSKGVWDKRVRAMCEELQQTRLRARGQETAFRANTRFRSRG